MVIFPHCKINLGLRVVAKRNDGYHDLHTIFYAIPLRDVLEIVDSSDQTTSISISGLPVEGSSDSNLCIKAYNLLKKDFPTIPPVHIFLHKNIPMGAGLGGGSSDGASTLLLLNKKFNLGLQKDELIRYSLQLGSDCPFFILDQPCFAVGRGEIMEPIDLDLSNYSIVLVSPGIHVSTAMAFSKITPSIPPHTLKDLIQQPIALWQDSVVNDFEQSVFSQYPALEEIKKSLYHAGALYASMTGTGSTVFGIFEKNSRKDKLFGGKYREDWV